MTRAIVINLVVLFLFSLLFLECCTLGLDSECIEDDNCTYTGGTCINRTCSCDATYFRNGESCVPRVSYGQPCSTAEMCLYSLTCTSSTCSCSDHTTEYFDTDQCKRKKLLGEQCSATIECLEDKSECSGVCQCVGNYYDTNNADNGGECLPLTYLNVGGPKIKTRSETYLVIQWTAPSAASAVEEYHFQVGGLPEVNVNKALEANITNLTPGVMYTIDLFSVDTNSRPDTQKTSVSINVATKPARPGPFDIANSDLNAADGQITIKWNYTGTVSFYSVTINDTNVNPSSQSNVPSNLLMISNVKNGHRYHITLTAISNDLMSDEYTEEFRTIITKPNPPVLKPVDESNRFSTSIYISWSAPALPNGDIMYYLIDTTGLFPPTQVNTTTNVLGWKVQSLLEEQHYCFTVKTVNDGNEMIRTSDPSNQICGETKAGVSTMPQSVTVHLVQSRSIQLSWDLPKDSKGSLFGYRLQLIANSTCQVEVVFLCTTNCAHISAISFNHCTVDKQIIVNKSSIEMNTTITYTVENLLPNTEYKIEIAAINANGDGERNENMIKTDSEVPQKPQQVSGTQDDDPKTLHVSWKQPLPRPGITIYIVKVYEEDNDGNNFNLKQERNVSGYFTQTTSITGLEEYWQYKFMIVASTIKGSISSDMSYAVRTKYAAPGDIEKLEVNLPPNVYTQMDITWNAPLIRNRNSIIREYRLIHNITGIDETLVIMANETVKKTLTVTPEETYLIQVYAVNTMGQNGLPVEKIYVAKPGPPMHPNVPAVVEDITCPTVTTQTTIKVSLVLDWFLDETNGKRTDGGVMVCPTASCGNYGLSSLHKVSNHFSTLDTWKASKKTGFTKPYRVTNRTWVDDQKEALSRRKRSTTEIELIIGEDNNCDKREYTVYCNGPLPAGKRFIVVAFVCTNGGCTESKQFGPYSTQADGENSTGVPIGAVVGVGFGCALFTFVVMLVIIMIMRKRMWSKNSDGECKRNRTDGDNQYEGFGMDNVSAYEELGAKSNPNVYDHIDKVDRYYENTST